MPIKDEFHAIYPDSLERQLPPPLVKVMRMGLILTLHGMMTTHRDNLSDLEQISALADEAVGSW